jgi:hypothetical protein
MPENNSFSPLITVFQERQAPEKGYLAGYAALIYFHDLAVPLPDILSLISQKHKRFETGEWRIFTPRYRPEDSLSGHLTFAIKHEGIELGVLKKLFEKITEEDITQLIKDEPTGAYSRRIWFLYEWLLNTTIDIPDLTTGNYAKLVDESLQYGLGPGSEVSRRHRIVNNLPGVRDFCPMIRKTAVLESYLHSEFSHQIEKIIGKIHPDVMARTASFLLLKDSKASYAIEGERPAQNRAQRWGRIIGQAGATPVSRHELERLQQIVIDNSRFTKTGVRTQEGFVGEHDRRDGNPIPEHISARYKDLDELINGLVETTEKLESDKTFDAVLAAVLVAFGFVYIHPFVDGNGRIHRYLIHHVLHRKNYVRKGIIFPVSAIIQSRMETYRRILESVSRPRMNLIEWKSTRDNNVEVLNETIDLYRYFDATKHAEFIYSCVQETIKKTIPEEVKYLERYDLMKSWLDDYFEMPDKTVSLLVRFLEQGNGKLSNRARSNEFKELSEEDVRAIEDKFNSVFD